MITQDQCRAARGLLSWKQSDLAEACGISKTAITNFESGAQKPRQETLEFIHAAFDKAGVEFIGNYGVQRRQTFFRVIDNQNALPELWDDIFETMQDGGGEILISNVDERAAYLESPENLIAHVKRLQNHNIAERILMCEGNSFFIQPPECYRWVSKETYMSGLTTYVYNGKVALRFWNQSVILVISHPVIYEQERQRFNYVWDKAIMPPYDDLSAEYPG